MKTEWRRSVQLHEASLQVEIRRLGYIIYLQVGPLWSTVACGAFHNGLRVVGSAEVIMNSFLIAGYSHEGNLQIKHLHEQGS